MSFIITTYFNKSPANKVDKELEAIAYGTGVLRDSCSIIDPVVLFETELIPELMTKSNYCVIEEFGRSYFITNIISVTNKLWEFHLHVDVLMTYRDQLRRQDAVISRTVEYSKRNMLLDDGWFSCYQDPIFETNYFSVTNPFEAQEYVLVAAGS